MSFWLICSIYIIPCEELSVKLIFSEKGGRKRADPPRRSSPLWCVAKRQPLWYYCPVVDADVIYQAGEETCRD